MEEEQGQSDGVEEEQGQSDRVEVERGQSDDEGEGAGERPV